MFSTSIQTPSTKTVITAATSAAAAAMLIRSVARDFVPPELQAYLHNKLWKILNSFSTRFIITIQEFNDLNPDHLFKAAEIYLQPTMSPDTKRIRVTLPKEEHRISLVMDKNQELIDSFNGAVFKWKLVSKKIIPKSMYDPNTYSNMTITEERYFQLSFHRRYKEMVFSSYLPYILEMSKEIKEERKTLKLFTLRFGMRIRGGGNPWQSVNLDHPATFDTLAMNADLKKAILDDLDRFVERKNYYRKVGKAWKRGYLLYGPPGTGKSSLIAAMANYLNFDIYDLELCSVRCNSDLKKLVITMANKSILVLEDIDCSIKLKKQARHVTIRNGRQLNEGKEVTLSGLLNFLDGLWSTCGDERIIIFTTNHKDRIDPALLRPGRMDMHIHMSYCSPSGFGTLALNYLGITEHPLFKEVECLLERKKMTPAEVAEQLMMNEEPEPALRCLIEFLKQKTEEDEKSKPIQEVTSESIQNTENDCENK